MCNYFKFLHPIRKKFKISKVYIHKQGQNLKTIMRFLIKTKIIDIISYKRKIKYNLKSLRVLLSNQVSFFVYNLQETVDFGEKFKNVSQWRKTELR